MGRFMETVENHCAIGMKSQFVDHRFLEQATNRVSD